MNAPCILNHAPCMLHPVAGQLEWPSAIGRVATVNILKATTSYTESCPTAQIRSDCASAARAVGIEVRQRDDYPHTSHLTPHTSHFRVRHRGDYIHTEYSTSELITLDIGHLTPYRLTPQTSHLTPQPSHFAPHTSHFAPHTSHIALDT